MESLLLKPMTPNLDFIPNLPAVSAFSKNATLMAPSKFSGQYQ